MWGRTSCGTLDDTIDIPVAFARDRVVIRVVYNVILPGKRRSGSGMARMRKQIDEPRYSRTRSQRDDGKKLNRRCLTFFGVGKRESSSGVVQIPQEVASVVYSHHVRLRATHRFTLTNPLTFPAITHHDSR